MCTKSSEGTPYIATQEEKTFGFQFKQRFTLCNVTYLSKIFRFSSEWNFFESYHGKGAVDAIGGQVKRMAWMAVKSRKKIQNATEFVHIVGNKSKHIFVQKVLKIHVEEVKCFLDKRLVNVPAIPGTHQVHFVRALDVNVIEYAHLPSPVAIRIIHKFH